MTIYSVKHPVDTRVIFVGSTNQSTIIKIQEIIKNIETLQVFLSEMETEGLKPLIDILEVVNYSGWKSRELSWKNKLLGNKPKIISYSKSVKKPRLKKAESEHILKKNNTIDK